MNASSSGWISAGSRVVYRLISSAALAAVVAKAEKAAKAAHTAKRENERRDTGFIDKASSKQRGAKRWHTGRSTGIGAGA